MKLKPREPDGYIRRGQVYAATDDVSNRDACLHFPMYLAANLRSPCSNHMLSWMMCLNYFVQYEKAIVDLTKALEINPNVDEARVTRGGAYFKTKDFTYVPHLVPRCITFFSCIT